MKSIRGTIFTWYFTSVVCFILASVTFFFFASKIIIKEFAVADHARLNTFIAKNLQAHFDNKLLPIERLAQRCQAINCTQETAITMVKTFLELLPDYSSIHLYDSFGDLVFHTRQAETPKYIPKPNIKIEKL